MERGEQSCCRCLGPEGPFLQSQLKSVSMMSMLYSGLAPPPPHLCPSRRQPVTPCHFPMLSHHSPPARGKTEGEELEENE